MKSINFINSPSPAHQQGTHRWLLFSFLLFSATIIVISIKQTNQLWRFLKTKAACYEAEQQCCSSNECLDNYRSYAEQSRTITQKLNQLLTVQNSLKNISTCMRDLAYGTHNSMLEYCDIKESKAKVSLRVPQQENIQLLTQTLSQTKWAQHVLLESINATQSNDTLITVNISLKI